MACLHLVINIPFWPLWVWIYILRKSGETVLHYMGKTGYFIYRSVANVIKWTISYPQKCGETILHNTLDTGYFISRGVTTAAKLTISYPGKCGESAIPCLRKWSNILVQYPIECEELFIQYSLWLFRYVGHIFSGKLVIQFTKTIIEKWKQLAGALCWWTCALVIVALSSMWTLIKVVSVIKIR